jgi:hypothetical protein
MRAICAALLLVCSSAAVALQARDIDRDGVTDAYFDPLHNQTWLAQASAAGSASLYWHAYAEAASRFDAAWRLPQLLDASVAAASCSVDWATPQVHCVRHGASEVSRLIASWGDALPVVSWAGNSARVDFDGVPDVALGAILYGSQDMFWGDTYAAYAPFWFLADGDVGVPVGGVATARLAVQAIPEPQTYAMVGLGLLALAWRRYTSAGILN